MSVRKNLLPFVVFLFFALAAGLTVAVRSAGKVPEVVTPESIGYIDLDQIHARFPDFARLQEIKTAYEKELNTFANYQRQSLATYLQELEKKKEEESAGKSEAEKQEIERKYEKLAQEKATEINQLVQQKNRELQGKLDQEVARAEEKLRQAIEAVAAQKGLNLVLVKNAVYYGGVDLTEEVIRVASRLFRPVLAGLFLLGVAVGGLGLFLGRLSPAWRRVGISPPGRPSALPAAEKALTLEELKARFTGHLPSLRPGEALFPVRIVPSIDLAGLLAEVHASIRATERAHREAAALAMTALRAGELQARLAAAKQAQEEYLAAREREMVAEEKRLLAAYGEEIRREALPRLSAIQMELAFSPEKKRQEALEEELLRLTAAIEERITRRGQELAEERRRALGVLREEAQRELDRLTAILQEEQDFFSGEDALGEGVFSAWEQEDRQREAALLTRWSVKED